MTSRNSPAPSPQRAVYGFAVYVFFVSLFIAYCLWVYLPTKFLKETLGLHYLPEKYFALSIPGLILIGIVICFYLIYPFISLSMTPSSDHISTVKDSNTIYRCRFMGGEICENIIKRASDSCWPNDIFCENHSGIDNESLKAKCNNCTDYNGDGSEKKRNGFEMPPARDMDLREVCEELF